jgi:hypothetical protein
MDYVPGQADFAQTRVTNSSQSEVIRQRMYDWQLYSAAGQSQFSFFSQPVGQGVTSAQGAVVGSPKTLWDTNQEIPSTLPSGKSFQIESIEVVFYAGSVSTANTYTPAAPQTFAAVNAAAIGAQVNDINTFYQSGMLELSVLSKVYLRETPMQAFPPKTRTTLDVAVSTNSATTAVTSFQAGRAEGRPYYVEPKITLQPAVNFEVLIRYPAAVALPSGFNGRVGVIMDGYLMRASQ